MHVIVRYTPSICCSLHVHEIVLHDPNVLQFHFIFTFNGFLGEHDCVDSFPGESASFTEQFQLNLFYFSDQKINKNTKIEHKIYFFPYFYMLYISDRKSSFMFCLDRQVKYFFLYMSKL